MAKNKGKQFIYVVQSSKRTAPSLEEREITRKDIMQKAKKIKNDEFYTRYEDVEKELSMYNKSIWKNKTVFCNCDDAVGSPADDDERHTSAFPLFFLKNFNELGLKKLICTGLDKKSYTSCPALVLSPFSKENVRKYYNKEGVLLNKVELRSCPAFRTPNTVVLFNQGPKGYIFTKDGYREIKEYPEGYTGSFDHPLSLKILKEETDIVCTNPPFSRAIDYWKVTIESGKKFIIISNIANVLTTAYVRYFKDNKVWAGFNRVDYFFTPKKELTEASAHWYTNFPIKDRPKYKQLKIIPLKEIPEKNKKYDDSKMLLVDNCYIPSDYKKSFAVSTRPILNGLLEKGYTITQDKEYYPYISGKKRFARVLVQKI